MIIITRTARKISSRPCSVAVMRPVMIMSTSQMGTVMIIGTAIIITMTTVHTTITTTSSDVW